MVTLDLADTLTIDAGGDGLTVGGPFADGVPTDDSQPRRPGAARSSGARAARARRQADPPRRRARRRLGRRRRGPALGRRRRPRGRGRGSAPTSRSASSAGGPGCAASARSSSRSPRRAADRHAGRAAAARQHAGRLPGLGRARRPDGGRPQRPRAGGARRRAASWPRGATASRELRGVTPVLAGSGATWFVDGRARRRPRRLAAARALTVVVGPQRVRRRSALSGVGYLRRWWRVRRSIFLCFFLRMRLRRFLISEPIRSGTLPAIADRAIR